MASQMQRSPLTMAASAAAGAAIASVGCYLTAAGRGKFSGGSKLRKQVAVLGGAFNPVTSAHMMMAAEIVHSRLVDEVWHARQRQFLLTVSILEEERDIGGHSIGNSCVPSRRDVL